MPRLTLSSPKSRPKRHHVSDRPPPKSRPSRRRTPGPASLKAPSKPTAFRIPEALRPSTGSAARQHRRNAVLTACGRPAGAACRFPGEGLGLLLDFPAASPAIPASNADSARLRYGDTPRQRPWRVADPSGGGHGGGADPPGWCPGGGADPPSQRPWRRRGSPSQRPRRRRGSLAQRPRRRRGSLAQWPWRMRVSAWQRLRGRLGSAWRAPWRRRVSPLAEAMAEARIPRLAPGRRRGAPAGARAAGPGPGEPPGS
jgi:hypothetical protein